MARTKAQKERRQADRKERDTLRNQKEHDTSRNLAHFEDMMDPTSRDIVEAEYIHLIAEPETAKLVGVPLALGGIPPTSVKVRVKVAQTMLCGPTGSLSVALYACRSPNYDYPLGEEPSFGSGSPPVEAYDRLVRSSNLCPKIGTVLTTLPPVTETQFITPILATGQPAAGQPLPSLGNSTAAGPAYQLNVPDLGLNFAQAKARMVAQEVEIFPAGNFAQTAGVMFSIVPNDTSTVALNGLNSSDAYGLQNTTRTSFPVSNWPNDQVVRFVRVPQNQEDLNFMPVDWTNFDLAPPDPAWQVAGPIWAALFIEGAYPGMPVRVESTVVYEYIGPNYAFASPNNQAAASAMPVSSLSGMQANLNRGAVSRGLKHLQAAGAVGETMIEQHGPKHATGFLSFLSKIGSEIGNVAKEILPGVLGMGLSALSEGAIPPQVGATIGSTITHLGDKIAGVEGVQHHGFLPTPELGSLVKPHYESRANQPDLAQNSPAAFFALADGALTSDDVTQATISGPGGVLGDPGDVLANQVFYPGTREWVPLCGAAPNGEIQFASYVCNRDPLEPTYTYDIFVAADGILMPNGVLTDATVPLVNRFFKIKYVGAAFNNPIYIFLGMIAPSLAFLKWVTNWQFEQKEKTEELTPKSFHEVK